MQRNAMDDTREQCRQEETRQQRKRASGKSMNVSSCNAERAVKLHNPKEHHAH